MMGSGVRIPLAAPPPCYPCVRYDVSPMSRAAHVSCLFVAHNSALTPSMRPPVYPSPTIEDSPQQYMHRARMFRDAAGRLVDYTNSEVNWPRYALLMHAIELALKAFAKQREMQGVTLGKRPSNHDLQAWYDLAVQCGLANEPAVARNISVLNELHFGHFTRYPQYRAAPIPDLSVITDQTVEHLMFTITQIVNPR
jgi:hypothetical protein